MTTKYNSIRDIADDMYIHNTNKLNSIIKKFINKHLVKYYLDIASKSYESTTENIAAEIWADYLREDPEYSTIFDKKIEILSTQFSKSDIINMYKVLGLELPDDTSVSNLRRHFDDVYYEF